MGMKMHRTPQSLKELGPLCPNLHPHLVVVPHDQLYQLLENGTVDVIFDIHKRY